MRKIRVMLIDDERAIRELLKIRIHWEKYHMEVVGEAGNASRALNIIDTVAPDILIVDIKMPFMDGIEFSQIISKRYPATGIIILSAYADFEYAQKCIGIKNVLTYLLKPLDVDDMEKALAEFRESIDESCLGDNNCNSMLRGQGDEQNLTLQAEKRQDNGQDLIVQIEEYIKENFGDKYMNIGAIAEELGYSSGYLGMVYKKRTGMLLSDKIFQVRMEHAINYKRKGEKMYVIAKKVGIVDPFYFSKCFRKYTGKSFSEFTEEGL